MPGTAACLIDTDGDTWLPFEIDAMARRFRSAVVFAPRETGSDQLPEGESGRGAGLLLKQYRDGWRNSNVAWCPAGSAWSDLEFPK